MTVFLLVLILLVLMFPRAVGVLVWFVIGLLWWHWPTDEQMAKARVEPPPAVVEQAAEPAPPRSPNELDFRPVYRPDGKPAKRIQH